jgi:hypothetical protein
MRKKLLIAVLALTMIFSAFYVTAELLNITTAGVDGNWVIYDGSKNIICTFDATNRKLSFPSGSVFDVESGGYFKIAGTAVTATATQLNRTGKRYLNAGTGTESANTDKSTTGLFYSGSITVTAGTNVVITGLSPGFTGTDTYQCLVSTRDLHISGATGAWKCAHTSSTSITISTETAATDTIDYMIVGY